MVNTETVLGIVIGSLLICAHKLVLFWREEN